VTAEPSRSRRIWQTIYLPSVALALIYVAWAPHTADLAGQTARAELFRRSGFVPYWAGWYSGLSTTGYSLTTPPLLGWFGPAWLGALSIVATALVAAPLLLDARRPRAGAAFVVIAATLNVISGRTTFAVGVVVALAALLATQRRHRMLALVLGLVTTFTSPVAGFLLLVVAAALFLRDSGRRSDALGLGVGVVAGLGFIDWLARGDGGGYQPFTRTSLLMAVGTTLVVAISPVGKRVRAAAVLTVIVLFAVYVVHTPIGSNATRIAVLGAAPAIVAASRSRILLLPAVVVASLLPLSQLHNDLAASHAADDTSRAFVAPLLGALTGDVSLHGYRVEVVDTATHWPSTYLLPQVTLARGWERQVDESRNPLFYGRAPLTAATYRAFLDRNAVGVVALARGVPLDYGATREASLVARGLPYLQEIWSNANWTLYAVDRPLPIVAPPAQVVTLGDTGLTMRVPAAGRYSIRMRWSPYLVASSGTVSRAPGGDVELAAPSAGPVRLHAVWRFP